MNKGKFYALSYCLIFCLLSLICIYISWSRLPTIAPDSLGYLDFNPIRPSFYPIFLDFLGMVFQNENFYIIVQILIYLCSFAYLIFIIHIFIKRQLLTFLVGLSISTNFYMHSFHSTILTESITLSVINLYICGVVKLFYCEKYSTIRNNIVFLGLLSGLLIGLKPAMITFIPCGLIVVTVLFLKKRSYFLKNVFYFFLSIFLILIVEKITYKLYHEERESVSELILLGKTSILTTHDSFQYPKNLTYQELKILQQIDKFFNPYQNWLNTNPNLYVTRVVNSNIEVLGQLSILKILNDRFGIPELEKEIIIKIGKESLLANSSSFFSHGFMNYVEIWMVNSLSYALYFQDAKLPNFDDSDLNRVIPIINLDGIKFSSAIFLFFFIAFGLFSNIAFLLITILILRDLALKRIPERDTFCIFLFFLIALSNIFFVAFANTPLTRYLMPNFSMLIIANTMFLNKILSAFKSKKDSLNSQEC